jgi:acyl-CoA ligase (AMP-forming) (exosortase A-associated)
LWCNAGELLRRQSIGPLSDKVVLVDGARRVTCAELHTRALAYASVLKQVGVRKGDRVGIFLRRSIEAVAAVFATWTAGGVAVIINDTLRTRQVDHILDHSEATCVVSDTRQMLAVPEFPCATVINVDHLETAGSRPSAERVVGADLAALIYTSGSTGMPKGVMLTHDNLLSGTQIVSEYLELTSADVIMSVLPFSFDYGLNQVLTTVFMGATLVIQPSLFPPDICRTIHRERVTGLAGVPTLWLQLTGRLSPFLKTSCPTLRYITNSGGRLPEETVRQIRAAHPHLRVYLMYGLTEAFRSTYLPPHEVDRRPTSMGKAIPNVEILVVSEDGRRCAPGEIGELVHRGANISRGYWRDPDSTSRVLRPHPLAPSRNGNEELVVYSGDLVTTDEEGYLYYVGRKDMQFKSRGVRVSPEEIERWIHSSGLVSNVVAFALPHADGDNDIALAVIPAEAATACDALHAFCRKELPEYMWPRAIWPMAEFPLTSTGKPNRPAIGQMYADYARAADTALPAARTA